MSRECQQRNPRGPPISSNTSSASEMARHGSKKVETSNVYVKLKLAGKEVSCLVDSGCDLDSIAVLMRNGQCYFITAVLQTTV